MTGQIVHTPPSVHACMPGMELVHVEGYSSGPPPLLPGDYWCPLPYPPVGTIWRCECGRTWECVAIDRHGWSRTWLEESRWRRWRRERRQLRARFSGGLS